MTRRGNSKRGLFPRYPDSASHSKLGRHMQEPLITIYHNPECGTSRNVLAHLVEAGLRPQVIEYLRTPPDRATLVELIRRMGVPTRAVLRAKEPLCATLGLDDPTVPDAILIDRMIEHPVLINRPIVVAPDIARLCRPSETVLELIAQLRSRSQPC